MHLDTYTILKIYDVDSSSSFISIFENDDDDDD